MKTTQNTQASDINFKDKLNFSNLLEKNQKKLGKSPVSNLIKSTKQTVIETERNTPRNDLLLNDKLSRIEGLVQSLIINQHNLKDQMSNQIEHRIEVKDHSKFDFKGLIQSILLVTTLAISVLAIIKNEAPKKLQQEKPSQTMTIEQPKITKYYLTKYINLRARPSTKGEVLIVLPINGLIEKVENKGNWTKVKYKDFTAGTEFSGWIWGTNFKKYN